MGPDLFLDFIGSWPTMTSLAYSDILDYDRGRSKEMPSLKDQARQMLSGYSN